MHSLHVLQLLFHRADFSPDISTMKQYMQPMHDMHSIPSVAMYYKL
jgi:hypothetical protein